MFMLRVKNARAIMMDMHMIYAAGIYLGVVKLHFVIAGSKNPISLFPGLKTPGYKQ